jgi:hypothetical protein
MNYKGQINIRPKFLKSSDFRKHAAWPAISESE